MIVCSAAQLPLMGGGGGGVERNCSRLNESVKLYPFQKLHNARFYYSSYATQATPILVVDIVHMIFNFCIKMGNAQSPSLYPHAIISSVI